MNNHIVDILNTSDIRNLSLQPGHYKPGITYEFIDSESIDLGQYNSKYIGLTTYRKFEEDIKNSTGAVSQLAFTDDGFMCMRTGIEKFGPWWEVAIIGKRDLFTEPDNDGEEYVRRYGEWVTLISVLKPYFDQFGAEFTAIKNRLNAIEESLSIGEHFRGYFETIAELQSITRAYNGDYAWIVETDTVWVYNSVASAWEDSGRDVPDQMIPKTTTVPIVDGDEAVIGDETSYAAGDHIHPHDEWIRTGIVNLLPESSIRFDFAKIVTDSSAAISATPEERYMVVHKRTNDDEANISLDVIERGLEYGENYVFCMWLEVDNPVEFALTLVADDATEINIDGTVMAYADTAIKRYSWRFPCDITTIDKVLVRWGSEEEIKFHYGFVLVRGTMAPDFTMSPRSIITANDTRYLLKGGDVTGGNYLFYGNLHYGSNLTIKLKDELFSDIYGDNIDDVVRFKPYWSGASYVSELGEGLGMSINANNRLAYITIPYTNDNPIIGLEERNSNGGWSTLLYTNTLDIIPSEPAYFNIGSVDYSFKSLYVSDDIRINEQLIIGTDSIIGSNEVFQLILDNDTEFEFNPAGILYNDEYVFHSGTSIIPSEDDVYDIGSADYSWNTIFVHTLEPENLAVTDNAFFRKGIHIWYGDDEDKVPAINFYFEQDLTEPTVEIYEPLRGRLRIDGKLGIKTTNISYDFAVGGSTGLQGNVRTYNLEAWEDNIYDIGIDGHKYRNILAGGNISANGMSANTAVFSNVSIDSLVLNSSISLPGTLEVNDINILGTLNAHDAYFDGEIEAIYISASSSMSANSLNVATDISTFNLDVFNTIRSNNATITKDLVIGSDLVEGSLTLYGSELIKGSTHIETDLLVDGDADIKNDLLVEGTSDLYGATTIGLTATPSSLTVYGTTNITGATSITGDTSIVGNVGVDGELDVEEDGHFESDLLVNGDSDLEGDVVIGLETTPSSLTVYGTTDLIGEISIDGSVDITENLHVSGTSDLDGAVVAGSTLEVKDEFIADTESTFIGGINANSYVDIDGDLNVDGAANFNSHSTMTSLSVGDLDVNGVRIKTHTAGVGITLINTTSTNQSINVLYDEMMTVTSANKLYVKDASTTQLGVARIDGITVRLNENKQLNVDFSSLASLIPDAPAYPYSFGWNNMVDIVDNKLMINNTSNTLELDLLSKKNGSDHGFTSTIESGLWLTKIDDVTSGAQKSNFSYTANTSQSQREATVKIVQNNSLDELILCIIQEGTPPPSDPNYVFSYVSSPGFDGVLVHEKDSTGLQLDFVSTKEGSQQGYTVSKTNDSWITTVVESSPSLAAPYVSSQYTFSANTTYNDRSSTFTITQDESNTQIVIVFIQKGLDAQSNISFDDISEVPFDAAADSTATRSVTSTKNGEWAGFTVTSPAYITATEDASQSGTTRSYTFRITTANLNASDRTGNIEITQN
jgi:hypothetical protein